MADSANFFHFENVCLIGIGYAFSNVNIFEQLQLDSRPKYCFQWTWMNLCQRLCNQYLISFRQFRIRSKGKALTNRNSLWRKFTKQMKLPRTPDIWLCFVLKVRKMWGLMLPQGPVYQRSVRLKIKLLRKPFHISETQHYYIYFSYFRNPTYFLYFRN